MKAPARTLIVDDSLSLAALCASYLGTAFDIRIVDSLRAAEAECERFDPEIILLDVELPDGNGLDLLDVWPPEASGCAVVVMTAHGSSEMAIDAIARGAFDYLEKPFDADRLRVTVRNAIEHRQLHSNMAELSRSGFADFVGSSIAMQGVYRIVESVAPSEATAFITGESGTGKELTALAVHQLSKRRKGPFHAINCGAIPGELMESALFGHVKGAFTGAVAAREGAASMADGGTLFLDEVCEMDPELQTKMLRFVQTGEFQRVGSDMIERADVRFVCATNRDPLAEVRAGRFREDLYYRLHVVPVHLPPLRERGDDVIAIAEHFLSACCERESRFFSGFTDEANAALLAYHWPGNVRELQNIIHNAVVLNGGEWITAAMLSIAPPGHDAARSVVAAVPSSDVGSLAGSCAGIRDIEPLWKVEQRAIEQAIESCGGNITQAASLLEVAPSTIYRKRQSWTCPNLPRSA